MSYRIFLHTCSILLIVLVAPLLAGDHPDGLWNGKPWGQEELESAVKKNDPQALAEWSYCSRNGWGFIPYDAGRIFQYAKQAAEKNNPYGLAVLSRCYYSGEGVTQDFQKALKLAKRSSDQGHPLGLKNLANCYLDGGGVKKDRKRGLEIQDQSIAGGCVIAKENRMLAHKLGWYGIKKDDEKATDLGIKLLDQHGLVAAIELIRRQEFCKKQDRISEQNLEKSVARLRVACFSKHQYSMSILGRHLCYNGDSRNGIPLMLEAAQTPHKQSSGMLLDLASGNNRLARKSGTVAQFSTLFRLAREAYVAGNDSGLVYRTAAESYLYGGGDGPIDPVKAESIVKKYAKRNQRAANKLFAMTYYSRKRSPIYDAKKGEAYAIYSGTDDDALLHSLTLLYFKGEVEDRDIAKAYATATSALEVANGVNRNKLKSLLKDMEPLLSPEEREKAEVLIEKKYPRDTDSIIESFETLKAMGEFPEDARWNQKEWGYHSKRER